MSRILAIIATLLISVSLFGQNMVTPQQFGAKADGKTDDTKAIQKALDSSNSVFFPAGTYITSASLVVRSNTTLWGTGRESRIVNTLKTGYGKNVLLCGHVGCGNDDKTSPNRLPVLTGRISDDRWSIKLNNVSSIQEGDLLLLTSGETGTHNPAYSYVVKVASVNRTQKTISLKDYVANSFLSGTVSVRNLKSFTQGTNLPTYVTENICVHDLSLEQSVDDGSGMYVLVLATYRSSFYNLWLKGNTCIGANLTVKTNFTNIECSFDGGAVDSPEYFIESKYSNLHGFRFGSRMNQIGLSILHGYGGVIENCDLDFGGNGKVGMLEQINPVITGNRFRNLSSSAGGIQGSKYGRSLIAHNVITSLASYPLVSLYGSNNVFTDNWIETASPRWLSNATGIDYSVNDLSNNHIIGLDSKDALYQRMPRGEIATISSSARAATITIKPGEKIELLKVEDAVSGSSKMTNVKVYFEKMSSAVVSQEGATGFSFSSPTLEIVIAQGYITYASADNSLRVVQKGNLPIVIRNTGKTNIVYTLTTVVQN